MRAEIRAEVAGLCPLDAAERAAIDQTLRWIDSGAELCRIAKPATPPRHLVAYFPVVDGEHVLLVDHINAQRWLPTGGHVEPGEHPRTTAERECLEELGLRAEFLDVSPVLLTCTETVGLTAGHTDVSLWYALKGDRTVQVHGDPAEFSEARWFHRNALPQNADPDLGRFMEKLLGQQG